MASFPHLRLARRPVQGRVLVVHRVAFDEAAALLPEGLAPRRFAGSALFVHCYSRLGTLRSRILPARSAPSHHLSYRIAAEDRGTGAPCVWVVRRETSSRLDARWNEMVLRREHRRCAFEVEKDTFRMRLRVTSSDREEFFLHAELATEAGQLLSTPRAVSEFLSNCGDTRPGDALAPEADAIDLGRCFAPEPLQVLELHSAFLREHFTPATTHLDGAWRLVTRRVQPARASRRTQRRTLLNPGGLPA
ncbi:MAG TPA: hypothetical protein ENJ09_12680 [Planctomycetes bacterium]|nr:hypothetical protein [Planctomycetota bacterium]